MSSNALSSSGSPQVATFSKRKKNLQTSAGFDPSTCDREPSSLSPLRNSTMVTAKTRWAISAAKGKRTKAVKRFLIDKSVCPRLSTGAGGTRPLIPKNPHFPPNSTISFHREIVHVYKWHTHRPIKTLLEAIGLWASPGYKNKIFHPNTTPSPKHVSIWSKSIFKQPTGRRQRLLICADRYASRIAPLGKVTQNSRQLY